MNARKIRVDVEAVEAKSLFLRTGVADGNLADGRPFELSISGSYFLMSVGKFGEADYTVERLAIVDLILGWAAKR